MKLSSLHYPKKWLLTSIIVVLLIGSVAIALAEINTTGTYFEVLPARNIVKPVSTSFTIDININNAPVNDTLAWGVTLEWNNTVLNITNVQEGPFLSSVNSTTFFFGDLAAAQAAGSIVIGGAITPATLPVPPKNLAGGTGTLCNVTFHVLSPGSSPLNLKDTSLANRAGASKDYPNNDSFFVAAGVAVHDVYVVSVDVNATQVQQGDEVTITVVIHNEGNYTQNVTVAVYADLITHDPNDPDVVTVGDEIVIFVLPLIPVYPCIPEVLPPIIWDTTNVPGEKWTISAEVIKPEDEDPHDNIYIGPVVHVISAHDLKIVDKTILTPKVSKGWIANVSVTVVNEGKFTENATIYLFAEDPTDVMNFTWVTAPWLEPCYWYQVVDPFSFTPEPSSWWHIIWPPELESKEFHVDGGYPENHTFHIDYVWPDWPEQILTPYVTAEREIVIGTIDVINLAVNETRTVTFHWNTTFVHTGTYTIKALVYPVAGEEMKNWEDNKFLDGTIEVVYYDIAVASIELLTDCYPGGRYPIVVPNITLANLGTEPVKVVVYYLADPDFPPVTDGDEIVFGIGIYGPLASGAVMSFKGCSPFGGWNTLIPAIAPPYNVPVFNTTYTIIASAYPSAGYRDDDMSNNVNIWGPWNLTSVNHDVAAGEIALWAPKRPGIRPQVQWGHPVGINVTVWNESPNTQSVTVTLYWLNNTTPVLLGAKNVTVPGDTVGWDQARFEATGRGYGNSTVVVFEMNTTGNTNFPPDNWYLVSFLANVTKLDFADGDPCDNSGTGLSSFRVRYWGDVNGDGTVDGGDQIAVGNALWGLLMDNPFADVNLSCSVDGGDQIVVGARLWLLSVIPADYVPIDP